MLIIEDTQTVFVTYSLSQLDVYKTEKAILFSSNRSSHLYRFPAVSRHIRISFFTNYLQNDEKRPVWWNNDLCHFIDYISSTEKCTTTS